MNLSLGLGKLILQQDLYSKTFASYLSQGISVFITISIQKLSFLSWARESRFSLHFLFKNLHFSAGLGNHVFHYNFYSKTFISQLGWGITFFITNSIQKPSFLSCARESHFSLQFLFKNLHFSAGLWTLIFHQNLYQESILGVSIKNLYQESSLGVYQESLLKVLIRSLYNRLYQESLPRVSISMLSQKPLSYKSLLGRVYIRSLY